MPTKTMNTEVTKMEIRTSDEEARRVLHASVEGAIEVLQDTSDEVLSARCTSGTALLHDDHHEYLCCSLSRYRHNSLRGQSIQSAYL